MIYTGTGDSIASKESIEAEFTFDEKGRLIESKSQHHHHEKHFFEGNIETVYSSDYNLEEYIEEFQKESALATPPAELSGYTANPRQYSTTIIERNAKGRRIKESVYRRNMYQLQSTVEFSYDKRGRLIKSSTRLPTGQEAYWETWTYDTADSVIQNIHARKGDTIRKTVFTYDKEHRIRTEAYFEKEGLRSMKCYDYILSGDTEIVSVVDTVLKRQYIPRKTRKDRDGKIIEQHTFRFDGSLIYIISFEYKKEGVFKTVRSFNGDNTQNKEQRITFDAYGNWTTIQETYPVLVHQGKGAPQKMERSDKYICKLTYYP